MSAYCETCAAIGNVYVNYRLFLLHGQSKYYDVLERTLYNGLISGVSLDGGGFFYPNPLESMGQHQRQPWFGCACCPSNIARFIPSLPGYVYAVKNRNVYINLFLSNTGRLQVEGKDIVLTQATQYPWNGDISLKIDKNKAGKFTMKIRIPGWVRGQVVPSNLYSYSDNLRLKYQITVNRTPTNAILTEDGYYTIDRNWKTGDQIHIHFDMRPRTVRAHNNVEADRGMVSVERGPLVYCAEWPDNAFDIKSILLNQHPSFEIVECPNLLYGIYQLQTQAQLLAFNKAGKLATEDVSLTLIPYYAWCHRGSGDMKVWLPQDLNATRPTEPTTLASQSKIEASTPAKSLNAINDHLVPKDANDRSIPYYHWWPKQGGTEWITYTFPEAATVQTTTIYWFDDQPWGGCKLPQNWKVYYKDATGNWQPVVSPDAYPILKGTECTVNFEPVKTSALKLEIKLPDKLSSGLFEWSVK